MTILINLNPTVTEEVKIKAAHEGYDVPVFIEQLVSREVALHKTDHYDPRELLATLTAFSDTDEFGDAEEQRTTFEILKHALDEDRPNQRNIFRDD